MKEAHANGTQRPDRTIDADRARGALPRDDVCEHEEQQRQIAVDVVERAPEDSIRFEPPAHQEQDRAEERLCARGDLRHREPGPEAVTGFAPRDPRPQSPDPPEREDGDDREPDNAMQRRHGADTTDPAPRRSSLEPRDHERRREQRHREGQKLQRRLRRRPDDLGPDRLRRAVPQRDRPLDGHDPAPEAADGSRQDALGCADRHAGARRRERPRPPASRPARTLRSARGNRPTRSRTTGRNGTSRRRARGCRRRRGTRRQR